MKNRENIKKISRLGYVIILFICSYLFFIGNSYTYYSPVGESLQRGLTKIFTEFFLEFSLKIVISLYNI
jgi:hypothetical protein